MQPKGSHRDGITGFCNAAVRHQNNLADLSFTPLLHEMLQRFAKRSASARFVATPGQPDAYSAARLASNNARSG
jgi:hypothetical protein